MSERGLCSDPFHINCKRDSRPGFRLPGSPNPQAKEPCASCASKLWRAKRKAAGIPMPRTHPTQKARL